MVLTIRDLILAASSVGTSFAYDAYNNAYAPGTLHGHEIAGCMESLCCEALWPPLKCVWAWICFGFLGCFLCGLFGLIVYTTIEDSRPDRSRSIHPDSPEQFSDEGSQYSEYSE
mmetsp:Transcript_129956/g.250581  ORF Transcript_129956/g.250581 Transcript_129956/m.250581 type:complete len:114 (-) Transcript_129956:87-428(-)